MDESRTPKLGLRILWIVFPLMALIVIAVLLTIRGHIISKNPVKKNTPASVTSKNNSKPSTTLTLDKNYFISPSALIKELKNNKRPAIIDIRTKTSFQKYRIPGSINIPLYTLKTKTYLKSQKVILVDEGYNCHKLLQRCIELRRIGFNISILKGGLNLWRKKGGDLIGDAFTMAKLDEIPPRAFVAEKDQGKWILIDISDKITSDTYGTLENAINIPYSKNSKESLTSLETLINKHSKSPETRFLIFDNNGESYHAVKKYLAKTNADSVFFLRGGFSNYKSFLETRNAMLHPGKKQILVEKGCSTCP